MIGNRILSLVLAVLGMAAVAPLARADWVWSKETGWIRADKAIRRSAKEMYDDATRAYEEKRYEDAYEDYRILAVYLPESRYTEEAMYRCGECLYQIGRYNSAYGFYKDYLAFYPGSSRVDDVIARVHEIGKAFLAGRRYDFDFLFFFHVALWPNRQAGIDILTDIVANYPYVAESDGVLTTVADYYYTSEQYEKAVEQYQKLLDLYLVSGQRDWAMFRIGECYYRAYRGFHYTHETLPKAHEAFRQYLKQFPEGKYVGEAAGYLTQVSDSLAVKELNIASYYHRTHSPLAAVTTLDALIRKYPESAATETARTWKTEWQASADKARENRIAKQERNSAKAAENLDKELTAREKRQARIRAKEMKRFEKEKRRREKIHDD